MPLYSYKALDLNGKEVSGQLEADTKAMAFQTLKDRRLAPHLIRLEFDAKRVRFGFPPSDKQKAQTIRQLGVLLSAGLPLMEAVGALTNNTAQPMLAQRAKNVLKMLRSGARFSNALEEEYPDLPPYIVRLAELGEATGTLGEAMSDAADQYEADLELKGEIRSALTYPTFLILAGTAIIILMFLFVVPQFANILKEEDADLPFISQIVIDTSLWLTANYQLGLLSLFGAVALGIVMRKRLGTAMTRLLTILPLTRTLLLSGDMAKWCSTMSSALSHGAGLMNAMVLAQSDIRSPTIRAGLDDARKSVRGGAHLDVALQTHLPRIDGMMLDMIRTGRISGRLKDMLAFASESYRRETKERTKKLTALVEPVAILSISLIVGTIVISIVLAMTSLYEISV